MKKISTFSVNYPVTILMFVLAIGLLGYISFKRLGVDLYPDLNNPKLYIELLAGERPPEEVENLFVERIESQAIRQSDVVEVSSVSSVGEAYITVEYSWNKDMDEAFLDLQKALNAFAQNAEIEELNISQYDPNATPVMIVAMENDSLKDLNAVRKVAENYIRNELVRLEGIADVSLSGQEEVEVVIKTNSYLLDAYGFTTNQIASKIQAYNRNVSGGTIEENGSNYSVKGLSMIESPNDLKTIIVGYYTEELENGSQTEIPIYLADVAEIVVTPKEHESIVRLNGRTCIGLSIYKEPKFNTVKAVSALKIAFDDISKALPGYTFTVIKDQGNYVSAAIGEVGESGLLGIVFAVLVLLLFLRRIRPTIVIFFAIPISIVATFTLMYFQGLTLNIMTLGGLALGAGMLVDNAIIVMDNIYRYMEKGKTVIQAAIDGTAEVAGAITASTLTTIVVFLPIVYLHGASGELFKDQAWTVAFSLISSLVVAILVMPVLVVKIFPNKANVLKQASVGFKWYPGLLNKLLNVKWLVVFIAAALVGGAYLILPHIGSEFMPRSSSKNFTVELKLEPGTRLETTSTTAEKIDYMIKETLAEQVASIYTEIGSTSTSGTSGGLHSENQASMLIGLTDKGLEQYDQVIQVISQVISTNANIEFNIVQDESGLQNILGNDEPPLVVEVVGEELEEIAKITARVKEMLDNESGIFNVETSIENGAPEIDIKIDRVRAGLLNINIETIVQQVRERLEGANAGEYEEAGEMLDIIIRQPELSIRDLEDLEIKSGKNVYMLSDLAIISEETLPKEIYRRNQNRIGKVSASVDKSKPFDQVVKDLETKFESMSLPANYRIQVVGEELKRRESMANLTFALLLSIILVYMVMASQFESLVHPFTILLTIPLALVGAVATFYLLNRPFNIMAYIGMIMLVGIAVNDSIIFVDAIIRLRAQGVKRREAILQAGVQRIRPIIMTSLTTILALVPLTFGFGESSSLRSPMAWAVIGGLVTSTLLTLVVIPSVYEILDWKKDMAQGLSKVDE